MTEFSAAAGVAAGNNNRVAEVASGYQHLTRGQTTCGVWTTKKPG